MKTLKNIKKDLKQILLLFLIAILLSSCNKDQYEVIGDDLPTETSLNKLFDAALTSTIQTATFDASSTYTFTSVKGVKLTVTGSCLRKNGNPVTGQVKLKFIELLDRGTMLTNNKPTMVNAASGEKQLLFSGGEFYISVTQDNIELTSNCFMDLEVPTNLTGGPDIAMLPFKGTIDASGNLSWDPATGVDFSISNPQAGGIPNYSLLFKEFGWWNCDKYADYSGAKTTITTFVPQGYGNSSFVFLSSKANPSSLGKSFGTFPVGLECYIIFVTEKSGQFRYAIKPSTPLTANHQVTFSLSETTIGTQAQLVATLNALP